MVACILRGLAAVLGGLALLVSGFVIGCLLTEIIVIMGSTECALFIEWVFG